MTRTLFMVLFLAVATALGAPRALIEPLGATDDFQQHATWNPDSMTLLIEVGAARGYIMNLSAKSVDSARLVPLLILRDLERIDVTLIETDKDGSLKIVRQASISGDFGLYGGELRTTLTQTADRAVIQLRLTPLAGSEGELLGPFAAARADLNADGIVDVADELRLYVDALTRDNSFIEFLRGRSCGQPGGGCRPRMPCIVELCDIFQWSCDP